MDKTICVFGGSISWRACDYKKGGWVERLKVYCMQNTEDVEVYNLGISGNNTEDLLERFEKEINIRKPNVIILTIGMNDSQHIKTKNNSAVKLDKFRENISELIRIGQLVTDKHFYDGVVRTSCKENNVDYLDVQKIINVKDLEDGLHPNSRGHQKIFSRVKTFLLKNML